MFSFMRGEEALQIDSLAKSRSFFRPFSLLFCSVFRSPGLVEFEKIFHMTLYFGLYTLHDYVQLSSSLL